MDDVHNARLESSDPGARGITLMFVSDEEKFQQVNLLLRAAIMRVTSLVLIKRQEDMSSLQALLNPSVFRFIASAITHPLPHLILAS